MQANHRTGKHANNNFLANYHSVLRVQCKVWTIREEGYTYSTTTLESGMEKVAAGFSLLPTADTTMTLNRYTAA